MYYSKLTIFLAELAGTFGLIVAATGSITFDGRMGGELGHLFVVLMHFVGLSTLILVFGKYSMAHFNPAVTIGFFLAGFLDKKNIPLYFVSQAIGAILGSIFVKYIIGDYADLGLNFPNYSLPIEVVFGVEVLATMFLMGVILISVSLKKLPIYLVSIFVGGIVGLDVLFFGPISGASMNPIRSLAPALLTGIFNDIWLYWTTPFIGSAIVGLIYRKKYHRFVTR